VLPFQQLQQRLLHPFAAHVTRDARGVALTADLVDLIDEDDAAFRLADIVVGSLEQAAQDALHVLSHVAGLGEHGGVGDGEGHVEHAGDGLGQQGLATAGLTDQDDVALLDLHIVQGSGRSF
jgi:hypothetical protein